MVIDLICKIQTILTRFQAQKTSPIISKLYMPFKVQNLGKSANFIKFYLQRFMM